MGGIVCTAIVDNDVQKGNLCECIKILGGKPQVSGNTVSVEFEGTANNISKFIDLFEQYPYYGFSTIQ